MEQASLIVSMLREHGPGVALAVVMGALYWLERKGRIAAELRVQEVAKAYQKRNDEMADKVVQLSTESIKADTEHTAAVQSLTRMLESIDRRIT